MENIIYMLKDINTDEIVSLHKTMSGARYALVNYLIHSCGYTAGEWQEFAHDNNYDTVEKFQDAMRSMSDYDEEMMMSIDEYVVNE